MTPRRGNARSGPSEAGDRLDVFIAARAGISRSRAQKIIAEGLAGVDGKPARKNHVMAAGESVTWEVPELDQGELEPERIPLTIVHEDPHVVVVNKPADMVMYPGPGHSTGTLLNALLARYPEIAGVGGRGRPGIVHRLDRGTSGLVAVARSKESYDALVEMMKNREVQRVYLALVVGSMAARAGTIDAPMGRSRGNRKRMAVDRYAGRRAVSEFEVLERFGDEFTLVDVTLQTGRTHQIRVHFSHVGHPVAGDPEYSRGKAARRLGLERQFLHARKLHFEHPVSGDALDLGCDLPGDLEAVLGALRERR